LSLKLSDTRVYEPQIRARLGTTVHFCRVVDPNCQTMLKLTCWVRGTNPSTLGSRCSCRASSRMLMKKSHPLKRLHITLLNPNWVFFFVCFLEMVSVPLDSRGRQTQQTSERLCYHPRTAGGGSHLTPLPRKSQTNERVSGLLPEKWLKSRPKCGLDCLICAEFDRQRLQAVARLTRG